MSGLDRSSADSLVDALARAVASAGSGGHAGVSVAEELTKLAELRDAGVLSRSDWERAKTLYLGKAPDAREQAVSQLRQLYDLHRQGVLSESEFNTKKWEILTRTA